MRRFNLWLAGGVALAGMSGIGMAWAGGFMIGEMAARSAGMGSAFTAVADDASAAWHNPAGVAFMPGVQVMAGGDAIIVPATDFVANTANPKYPTAVKSSSETFFLPHVYATWKDPGSGFGTAISVNSPFGLKTDWPLTAPFASKATLSQIKMVLVNPSIVYRLTEQLSVAGGVQYANMFTVDLNNTLQDLSGNGDGWGGSASLLFRQDGFSLGVTYRSRIKVKIDGTAILKAAGGIASLGSTSITLPDQVNVGLAWQPNEAWTLSADVDWVNWKTFDAIDVHYASAAYSSAVKQLQQNAGAPVLGYTHLPEQWKATVAFRAGVEWRYAPNMRARFGYVFDPTPINDTYFTPAIPGNDRQLFTIGYGYDFSPGATIDLAYAFVYFKNRNQTASPATPAGAPESVKNGSYKGQAHVIAASLAWRF